MVHTGDKLIYGVQMSMCDAVNYLTKYVKKIDPESHEVILDDIKIYDLKNDIMEAYNYFDDIMEKLNLSIQLIKPPCCLFSDDLDDDFSKVYLGIEVCSNHIVQRFSLFEFNTFSEYKKFYLQGIVEGEQNINANKDKLFEDLKKILPKTKCKPKFYSLPNDCASCT